MFIENPDEFASDDDWFENETGDDDDDDVIMEQVGGAGEESEGWWDVQHNKERHVKKIRCTPTRHHVSSFARIRGTTARQ